MRTPPGHLFDHPAGRTAVFTLLYASEGAPIGFIWWAMPTLLRAEGLPIAQITGLTAVVVLPWVFKFTWAPLVDTLRSPRWGYRAWIRVAQGVMGLTLLPLLWLDPVTHFGTWRLLLLAHAVAAATQDVAIDALAINTVPPGGRGLLNGSMQAGMLAGRSLFGGGALLVAASFGREWVIAALIGWIWLALVALRFVREPGRPPTKTRDDAAAFRRGLAQALRRRTTWLGLGFALLSGAGFEATGQLAGPYLIDRDVPASTIGWFFGTWTVGAMLLGGLIGGRLSDRWGRLRSVSLFLSGLVATIGVLALAELGNRNGVAPIVVLTGMYFFIGLFTAASYALFMDLTAPRLGGTQFSAYMAATNGCEAWAAWAGGRLAGQAGYAPAFVVMSGMSLVSLVFVWRLSREAPFTESPSGASGA